MSFRTLLRLLQEVWHWSKRMTTGVYVLNYSLIRSNTLSDRFHIMFWDVPLVVSLFRYNFGDTSMPSRKYMLQYKICFNTSTRIKNKYIVSLHFWNCGRWSRFIQRSVLQFFTLTPAYRLLVNTSWVNFRTPKFVYKPIYRNFRHDETNSMVVAVYWDYRFFFH